MGSGDASLTVGAEQGWFTDPYGRHEARWLSNGKPTKLVRDGGVESSDEPPPEPPGRKPIPISFEDNDRGTTGTAGVAKRGSARRWV